MADEMLTTDRRCGKCGVPVTELEGEPHTEIPENGFMRTLSVAYTLNPCGHVFIRAVNPRLDAD